MMKYLVAYLFIDKWLEVMNEQFKKKNCSKNIYQWYHIVVHFYPHFMFIPQKPHTYGVKFETAADDDTFLFKLNFHKPTEDGISTKQVLAKFKR